VKSEIERALRFFVVDFLGAGEGESQVYESNGKNGAQMCRLYAFPVDDRSEMGILFRSLFLPRDMP